MLQARRLRQGDTIAVYSPSYPASATQVDAINHAIDFLRGKGFKVKCGALTGKSDFYRSGSIKERAEELNELIASPDVRCIMPVSGGFVSNSLLPYIDYEGLRRNPKIVIGFSDATAILLAIYAKTGLVTFYGPNLTCFGRKPPMCDETYEYMKNILVEPPCPPYVLPTPACWTDEYIDVGEDFDYTLHSNEMITVSSGSAEGRLIACNLNTLSGFMASEYMPKILEGDILLIEDKNLDAETVEREFSMLKVCGVFGRIGGLILGKHIDFDDRGTGRRHYEILREVMGQATFPVLSEFDCSHSMPMLTMPIGIRVRLDASGKRVTLLESWIA